jgi:hypothetical protein
MENARWLPGVSLLVFFDCQYQYGRFESLIGSFSGFILRLFCVGCIVSHGFGT